MMAPQKYTLFLILLLLCGCGGNSSMTSTPSPSPTPAATASLRVVNGNASENPINVLVDGAPVVSSVTFLKNTGYVAVPAGAHQVMLQGWANPPNETFMATFPENAKSTLLFEGWGPFSSEPSLITDDTTPPAAGNFKLRIVDGSVFTTFDVYILPSGTAAGGTPTITPMTISENSPSQYLSFTAGTYHVVFTDFQTLNVAFDTGPLTFAAGQNRTLFLILNCSLNACSSTTLTSMLLADLN